MTLALVAAARLELSEVHESGLHLVGDAEGEGFGPLQMFAASLALCTASVLVGYAENVLGISFDRLRIDVRWEYEEHPRRVSRLEFALHWPGLPEDRRDAARRAVESCTLHRTLERPPELHTRVVTEAA